MPINPTSSENEEEFISRCMSIETDTYPSEQAYAICKSKWDNGKMKKISSPYDRVNDKFNSIRIKQTFVQTFGENSEACWDNYIQVGTKIVNGREVPDCRGPVNLEEGVPHYTKDGTLYEGPTHKDADGNLMTGATHTENSEYLYHGDILEAQPTIDSSYAGEPSTGSIE